MESILDLKGRVALVTGAGQGVGRQVALHLAAHNAGGVIVNDFHAERAEAVAEEVRAMRIKALPVSTDVTDFNAVAAMVADAEREFGRIDILINNAGNAGPTTALGNERQFWETGPQEWANWLGTNLYGVLNCTHAVLPGMMARREGRLVTVVSDAGRVGEPHLAVYSAAKAGAGGFMRAIAKAVGRANITANSVALAATNTPGIAGLVRDDETLKKVLRGFIIRRMGEPSDAANLILFLASDAASWITGQTYPVNGGYSVSV